MQNIRAGRTVTAYALFARVASWLQSPFLLAIRLYWGWQFIQTGWGKFHTLGHVSSYFASLGIPLPYVNAVLISAVECAGGALLILGLGTRLTGLVLSADMLTAFYLADRDALRAILSDPGTFYAAAPFTFLLASLLVLIFGAGLFSLDRVLAWGVHRKTSKATTPVEPRTDPVKAA
jgi:putative oxidoreductase